MNLCTSFVVLSSVSFMALDSTSLDGSLYETSHSADGFPLNLSTPALWNASRLILLWCKWWKWQTSIVDEVDELMEHIKEDLRSGVFLEWSRCFITFASRGFYLTVLSQPAKLRWTPCMLYGADSHRAKVAKDAKTTKEPEYSKNLSSTLRSPV